MRTAQKGPGKTKRPSTSARAQLDRTKSGSVPQSPAQVVRTQRILRSLHPLARTQQRPAVFGFCRRVRDRGRAEQIRPGSGGAGGLRRARSAALLPLQGPLEVDDAGGRGSSLRRRYGRPGQGVVGVTDPAPALPAWRTPRPCRRPPYGRLTPTHGADSHCCVRERGRAPRPRKVAGPAHVTRDAAFVRARRLRRRPGPPRRGGYGCGWRPAGCRGPSWWPAWPS